MERNTLIKAYEKLFEKKSEEACEMDRITELAYKLLDRKKANEFRKLFVEMKREAWGRMKDNDAKLIKERGDLKEESSWYEKQAIKALQNYILTDFGYADKADKEALYYYAYNGRGRRGTGPLWDLLFPRGHEQMRTGRADPPAGPSEHIEYGMLYDPF